MMQEETWTPLPVVSNAPELRALLPVMVQLLSVALGLASMLMPPPEPSVELPEMVERSTLTTPSAEMPPPSRPAEQSKIEERATVKVDPERAQMPPPRCVVVPPVRLRALTKT